MEKLTDLKTTIEEFTATYDQMCPLVTNNSDKEDSQIVLNYVNDINAAYTEVLQVQSQNYEPLYTYTYGMQRIANDKENDTLLYYQYDARGSVIGQQKEDSSALHLKINYNDYGKPNRNLNNEYGYNAEAHDYSGTQYLRARYYNTDTGRFDQQDSYRGEQDNPISQNRYTYVWNSPNQYLDKSGNAPAGKGPNNFKPPVKQPENSKKPLEPIEHQNHKQPKPPGGSSSGASDSGNSSDSGPASKSSEGVEEARRQAMAERDKMRKEAEDLEKELREIENLNLDNFDFDSMPLAERLRLLREIKRICLDYGLYTENWDPTTAQNIIDNINSDFENKYIPNPAIDMTGKIFFAIDGVYFSVLGTFFDREIVKGAEIVPMPNGFKIVFKALMAIGIFLAMLEAIDYFEQTGDLIGALVIVVLEAIGMYVGWAAVELATIIGTIFGPGYGTLLGIIVGVGFSMWWTYFNGRDTMRDILIDYFSK